jgi:hypothetical protein
MLPLWHLLRSSGPKLGPFLLIVLLRNNQPSWELDGRCRAAPARLCCREKLAPAFRSPEKRWGRSTSDDPLRTQQQRRALEEAAN